MCSPADVQAVVGVAGVARLAGVARTSTARCAAPCLLLARSAPRHGAAHGPTVSEPADCCCARRVVAF